MSLQDTENLFRRYKGQAVTVKTLSGGIYHGRVNEITNDFVGLIEKEDSEPAQVFLLFQAIESMMVAEVAVR
jgi:hypothetical protein